VCQRWLGSRPFMCNLLTPLPVPCSLPLFNPEIPFPWYKCFFPSRVSRRRIFSPSLVSSSILMRAIFGSSFFPPSQLTRLPAFRGPGNHAFPAPECYAGVPPLPFVKHRSSSSVSFSVFGICPRAVLVSLFNHSTPSRWLRFFRFPGLERSKKLFLRTPLENAGFRQALHFPSLHEADLTLL